MIDFSKLNADSLAEIYLVANTPAYLLKKMRTTATVQWLSNYASVTDLIDTYNAIALNNDRAPTDIAVAYGALVALTLNGSGEARSALVQIDRSHLDWAGWIADWFLAGGTSASVVTFNAGGLLPERPGFKDGIASSRQIDFASLSQPNGSKVEK